MEHCLLAKDQSASLTLSQKSTSFACEVDGASSSGGRETTELSVWLAFCLNKYDRAYTFLESTDTFELVIFGIYSSI